MGGAVRKRFGAPRAAEAEVGQARVAERPAAMMRQDLGQRDGLGRRLARNACDGRRLCKCRPFRIREAPLWSRRLRCGRPRRRIVVLSSCETEAVRLPDDCIARETRPELLVDPAGALRRRQSTLPIFLQTIDGVGRPGAPHDSPPPLPASPLPGSSGFFFGLRRRHASGTSMPSVPVSAHHSSSHAARRGSSAM